jgi:hypothetical protein
MKKETSKENPLYKMPFEKIIKKAVNTKPEKKSKKIRE